MKVMFDSNVWQKIVEPLDYPEDNQLSDFIKIHESLKSKNISPYISETIFTLEAIKKIERQDFYSSKIGKIEITRGISKGKAIGLNISIGSQEGINFNERPILKKYFDKALELGFKIVGSTRLGGMKNEEVAKHLFYPAELDKFSEIFAEVVGKIESKGAGMAEIKEIGLQHDINWMKGLKMAEAESKRICKSAAEWADGDSVAMSIAIRCNYFCTRDQARGAGNKSVLSPTNLKWLKEDYNFETILPEDLAKLL